MSSRPLRIAHIIGTPTGAPWMVALVRAQKGLGHDVAVILPSLDGGIAPQLASGGIACHTAELNVLSASGMLSRVRMVLSLVRLLRRLRPDVVHSHLLPSVITARLASWIADVPVRFSANAGPLTLESEVLRAIEIGTAFCDSRTIASCQYTRELFTRFGLPERQTALIYYPSEQTAFDPALADGARVRRELGIASGTPLIGIVAHFYPPLESRAIYPEHLIGRGLKGHEVLLQAVPRVLAEFPDARFVFVGRGWGADGAIYESKLKELTRSLGLADTVLFTGERNDIPDTLAALDISLHPSLNDNLGGTLESLLMARPMIVSDIPGYRDTIVPEETGLTTPAGDSAALAEAIKRLLRDPELARRLGANGRRRMLERFTLAEAVAGTEALLATEQARAEEHYRLTTTLRRLARMPFHLLPIVRSVHRSMNRPSLFVRVWRRMKRVIRRVIKPAREGTAKPRIAQVAGVWTGSDWLVGTCRELTARGYEVVAVIDSHPGSLGERLDAAGIRHYAIPMTFATGIDRGRVVAYALNIPIAAVRLARILRRERIDIVHSHVFGSVIIARLASVLARSRHVAGIPGPRHLEAALTRRIDRATWWLDDATVAGCRYTRDLYAALGANLDRLTYIYYGADAARFDPAGADGAAARRALGVVQGAPLILLVAHFYPPTSGAQTPAHTMGRGPKGHEDFLAAARIIVGRLPEARFVLAGSGVTDRGESYRRDLMAQCHDDELLRDRVLFTGHSDDVPSLLAAADVAVQCSLTENLGGTIEALLMERPVVATRVGGMPESVRDGETGLLVPPSDPKALAAAILLLLENRDHAAELARAGRRLALQDLTIARTTGEVDALYCRVMEPAGV
jgi:glycosyltransferase involved in cell wall biosynthesis